MVDNLNTIKLEDIIKLEYNFEDLYSLLQTITSELNQVKQEVKELKNK